MNVPQFVLKKVLLAAAFVGTMLCLCLALIFASKDPASTAIVPPTVTSDTAQPAQLQKKTLVGLPTRIKIPRISVNAAVEQVGLTPQGALDVPDGPASAGWYSQGPRPGEVGSAVIDGHFGWTGGTPAIFDNLDELRVGDNLYVEDLHGVVTTFVVRETRTYGSEQDAADVFGSSDGKTHLNLVSCQGNWSKARQSYSSRLIVFADLEI